LGEFLVGNSLMIRLLVPPNDLAGQKNERGF
jgi:hypothetical protein